MTTDKKYAPDSLKYQWRLLGSVHRSDWATSLDKSVAFEVIDNYRKAHGNSRASLRYLEKATGATRPSVIASLRRLCENGTFSVAVPSAGTRPTAYALHFDKVAENASGIVGNTSRSPDPSGMVDNTSVVSPAIPLDSASGIVGNTESVLHVDGLQADLHDRKNDTRPPTAPLHADGLSATAARGSAVDGKPLPTFRGFLAAYAPNDLSRPARVKAQKEWDALEDGTDLAAVIGAAAEWRASWVAQNKPDAPRKSAAGWLHDEMFLKPAPTGYQKPEKASKAKPAKAEPGKSPTERPATQTVTITAAVVVREGSRKYLRISADGFSHAIVSEADSASEQEAGQMQLMRLADAAGLEGIIEDAADLIDKTVDVTWFGDSPVFSRSNRSAPTTGLENPVELGGLETNPPTEKHAWSSKPKPKIQPREIPSDREGKLATLGRWRKSGFFEEDAA